MQIDQARQEDLPRQLDGLPRTVKRCGGLLESGSKAEYPALVDRQCVVGQGDARPVRWE
jgi:hypothetical protein